MSTKQDILNQILLDVKGKSLGRAASAAAILLRGKGKSSFEPHIRPTHSVVIQNVGDLKIFPGKFNTKTYTRYSGYPSGLRTSTLGDVFMKNPKEVFRRAVWGMLPKNRSRKFIINNLKFD